MGSSAEVIGSALLGALLAVLVLAVSVAHGGPTPAVALILGVIVIGMVVGLRMWAAERHEAD